MGGGSHYVQRKETISIVDEGIEEERNLNINSKETNSKKGLVLVAEAQGFGL